MLQKRSWEKAVWQCKTYRFTEARPLNENMTETEATRDPGVKDGAGVKAEVISGVVEE